MSKVSPSPIKKPSTLDLILTRNCIEDNYLDIKQNSNCDGMFLLSKKSDEATNQAPKPSKINQNPQSTSIPSTQPNTIVTSNSINNIQQMSNGNFQILSNLTSQQQYFSTAHNQQGMHTVLQLNRPQFLSQIRPTPTNSSQMIIQPRQIIGVLQPVSIRRPQLPAPMSSVKLSEPPIRPSTNNSISPKPIKTKLEDDSQKKMNVNNNINQHGNIKKRPITSSGINQMNNHQNPQQAIQNKKRKFNPIPIAEKIPKNSSVETKPLVKEKSNETAVNINKDKIKFDLKNLVENPPIHMKDTILPPVGYRNVKYFNEIENEIVPMNYRGSKYNQQSLSVSVINSQLASQSDQTIQDTYLLQHLYLDPKLNICSFKGKKKRRSRLQIPASPTTHITEDVDLVSNFFWTVKEPIERKCSSPLLEQSCISNKYSSVKVNPTAETLAKNTQHKEILRISLLPISQFVKCINDISVTIAALFNIPVSSTSVDVNSSSSTADIIVNPEDRHNVSFTFDDKTLKELDLKLRKKYSFDSVHFSIDYIQKNSTASEDVVEEAAKTVHSEISLNIANLSNDNGKLVDQIIHKNCSVCLVSLKTCNSVVKKKLTEISVKNAQIKYTEDNTLLAFCSEECVNSLSVSMNQVTVPAVVSNDTPQAQSLEITKMNVALEKMSSRIPVFIQPMNPKISKYLAKMNFSSQPTVKRKNVNSRWACFSDVSRAYSLSKSNNLTVPISDDALRNLQRSYMLHADEEDGRKCILCMKTGDCKESDAGRLLSLDVDRFVHLNCALWCFDVYESVSGSLHNVHSSVEKALKTMCTFCGTRGAGLPCYHTRCTSIYHVPCAIKVGCMFFTDRGMYCSLHQPKEHPMQLKSLEVFRKVYISRDDDPIVAKVINDEDRRNCLRLGSVTLNNLGQLLPQHVESGKFHSKRFIYPVGFTTTRIFWSMRDILSRAKYRFEIKDVNNRPLFHVTEILKKHSDEEIISESCDEACQIILKRVAELRVNHKKIKLFPNKVKGEDFFGLTQSHIVRAIESLPGADQLVEYCFHFGRMELIRNMPLAINPTGCSRSEPRYRTAKNSRSSSIFTENNGNPASLTLQNTTLSGRRTNLSVSHDHRFTSANKCQQYRRLKLEVSNNVILGRSGIQGFGLFAAKDLEPHCMVIEYIGELIRNELADLREKVYESHNRGIYMFRLDENTVIDATMTGGLARYINHSCYPNCYTEFINPSDGSGGHIVIMTNRKILKGEELSYDYKFDLEDCTDKIPCLCGAPNCRKWMN